MITKIKHHPILTNISLFFVLLMITYSIAFTVSLWWLLIAIPVFLLYLFGFYWNEKYELICPECHRTYWDKTKYYCNHCGVLMVFRKKERVKKGERAKPGNIAVPTCSEGHKVYSYDSYCPQCGEQLKG